MIIHAGDPEALNLYVFDSITGELLGGILSVDTETGEAHGYAKNPDGSWRVELDQLVVEKHLNPVRIEKREPQA